MPKSHSKPVGDYDLDSFDPACLVPPTQPLALHPTTTVPNMPSTIRIVFESKWHRAYTAYDSSNQPVVHCKGSATSWSGRQTFTDANGTHLYDLRMSYLSRKKAFRLELPPAPGAKGDGQTIMAIHPFLTWVHLKMDATFQNSAGQQGGFSKGLVGEGEWSEPSEKEIDAEFTKGDDDASTLAGDSMEEKLPEPVNEKGEAVLAVRAQDKRMGLTYIFYGEQRVAATRRVRQTGLMGKMGGFKPEWEMDIAAGVDPKLASTIAIAQATLMALLGYGEKRSTNFL